MLNLKMSALLAWTMDRFAAYLAPGERREGVVEGVVASVFE